MLADLRTYTLTLSTSTDMREEAGLQHTTMTAEEISGADAISNYGRLGTLGSRQYHLSSLGGMSTSHTVAQTVCNGSRIDIDIPTRAALSDDQGQVQSYTSGRVDMRIWA